MGAFLVRGDLEEVRGAVRRALESNGFQVCERSARHSSDAVALAGRSESWSENFEALVRVEAHEDAALVHASFRCGTLKRIRLLVPTVAFATIVMAVFLYPNEVVLAVRQAFAAAISSVVVLALKAGASTPLSDVPEPYWVLAGAVLAALVLFGDISRGERRTSDALSQVETRFWEHVRKDFRVRLVALGRHRALPATYAACLTTAMLAGGGVFLYELHPLVLFCALPYLLLVWLHTALPDICERWPWLSARALGASNNLRFTILNASLLWLLVLGLGLTAGHPLSLTTDQRPGIRPLDEFRDNLGRNGLLDEVSSGDERMNQLRTWATHWAEELLRQRPDASRYAPLIEGAFVAAIAVPIGAALWLFLYVFFRRLGSAAMSLPETWREHTSQSQAEWIRLPRTIGSGGSRSTPFALAIILLFVLGAILNGLALLAAVDLSWFAVTDHALIFPQVQPIASWFFVPFLAVGQLGGPTHLKVLHLVARGVLLVVALPPLLLWGRRLTRALHELTRQAGVRALNLLRPSPIPEDLTSRVADMCRKQQMIAPRLLWLPTGTVGLAFFPSLFGLRPTLLVTKGALDQLTGPEATAAIAHELGHARQRTTGLRWLRIVSVLGGHPPWFLLLLCDFAKLEEEADQFALQTGAEPEAFAAAILKATMFAEAGRSRTSAFVAWLDAKVPAKMRKPLQKRLSSLIIIDRFLFSDDLIGCSHPSPRDRIAAVLKRSGADAPEPPAE